MKKERVKALTFETVLIIALIICAFFPFYKASIILALITTVGAIASSFMLRKKSNTFTNKKQILSIMILFAILYLALFYTLGIYSGFYRNGTVLNIKNIYTSGNIGSIYVYNDNIKRYAITGLIPYLGLIYEYNKLLDIHENVTKPISNNKSFSLLRLKIPLYKLTSINTVNTNVSIFDALILTVRSLSLKISVDTIITIVGII